MEYQYPVEVINAALEKGISQGIFERPVGESALAEMLARLDAVLTEAMDLNRQLAERREEDRNRPVLVEDSASIPFGIDEVIFLYASDQLDLDVRARIVREQFPAQAIGLIGPAGDWTLELIYTGHRVYELPKDYTLELGRRLIKAHPSSVGTRWVEVRVGEPPIEFN